MRTSYLGRIKELLWYSNLILYPDLRRNSDLSRVVTNPIEIMNIENPSEKAQVYAVQRDPGLIQHLKTPCEKAQMAAVVKDPGCIMFIEHPTETVQLCAVRDDPDMIRHIHSPSERVQLQVARVDAVSALFKIDSPTEKVQLEVVKAYPDMIRHIQDPSEKVQLAAVKKNPASAIFNIDSPTEKVQVSAVYADPSLLSAIKDPCEKARLLGVKNRPELIGGLSAPSEKVQFAAVSGNANVIKLIKNPTEKTQLIAVSRSSESIQFIRNPTERVQLLAINKDIKHATLIDNPCDKACILFANAELKENLIPLNTQNPVVVNLAREYLKEKRGLETGNADLATNNLKEQAADKLKESIRESLRTKGIDVEKGTVPQIVTEKEAMNGYLEELRDIGKISFASKGDEAAFNQRYDFLNQKESFYSHYEQDYLSANHAGDFNQRFEEKERLDKSKAIYDKNYKLEIRDTINNDGVQKFYHSVTPDGQDYIRYTSPEGNRLEIAPLREGGYGIRNSDNLTRGEYKPITRQEFDELKAAYSQYKERSITGTRLESRMNTLKEKYIDGLAHAGGKDLNTIGAELNPERFLYTERNRIMATYSNNPWGDMRPENVSREGMDKWAATLKEYSKMQEVSAGKVGVNVQSAPPEMSIKAGRRELTVRDGKATISTNGKTYDATGVIRGMREQGVDITKVPEKTMAEMLKGGKVPLPDSSSKSLFSIVKGPVGYGLKAFGILKQVNSMAAQEA